jgi:hypothetical protein
VSQQRGILLQEVVDLQQDVPRAIDGTDAGGS